MLKNPVDRRSFVIGGAAAVVASAMPGATGKAAANPIGVTRVAGLPGWTIVEPGGWGRVNFDGEEGLFVPPFVKEELRDLMIKCSRKALEEGESMAFIWADFKGRAGTFMYECVPFSMEYGQYQAWNVYEID